MNERYSFGSSSECQAVLIDTAPTFFRVCAQRGFFFFFPFNRFLKEPKYSNEILENTDYLMVLCLLMCYWTDPSASLILSYSCLEPVCALPANCDGRSQRFLKRSWMRAFSEVKAHCRSFLRLRFILRLLLTYTYEFFDMIFWKRIGRGNMATQVPFLCAIN